VFGQFLCEGVLYNLFPCIRNITKGGDRNYDCFRTFRLTKQRGSQEKEGEEDDE
jgi:hypothetical protein